MLGLFSKKYNAKNRAYQIATLTSNYASGLDEAVDNFLEQLPEYSDKRNKIIDELQWIIATGGLISIRIITEHKKAKETREQLIEFYRQLHESNPDSSTFNDDYLEELEKKFEDYMVRFNRGVAYRDTSAESYNEALLDVANESIKYFTGEIRSTEITSMEEAFELQERLNPPDKLELFVRDILSQFIKVFLKEFEKVKLV